MIIKQDNDNSFIRLLLQAKFTKSYPFKQIAYTHLLQKHIQNLNDIKDLGYIEIFEKLTEIDRMKLV